MRTFLDCIPCFIKQSLEAARMVTPDERIHAQIIREFLEHFYSDDVVIAKGQGNYEALNTAKREIFFLLVVKCPLVAGDMDKDVGELILKVN